MARYIEAVKCAEIISEQMGIPLGDLVDVFSDIPSADVVPKSEVEKIFEEIEEVLNELGYFDEIDFKALKNKDTKSEDKG